MKSNKRQPMTIAELFDTPVSELLNSPLSPKIKISGMPPSPKNTENFDDPSELSKNLQYELALQDLFSASEENDEELNMHSGLAEIEIDGVRYQVQLSLISDRDMWCGPTGVLFSESKNVERT